MDEFKQPGNVFEDTAGAVRDEDIDLSGFIKKRQPSKKEEIPSTEVQTTTEVPISDAGSVSVKTEELSPLERMKRAGASSKGLVVSNEKYNEGLEKTEKKAIMYNDDRVKAINESLSDMDDTLRKRKAVVILQRPVTSSEYTQMMVEIDAVKFDEAGVPRIELYDVHSDDNENGKKIPKTPVFIRLRTKDDPTYEEEQEALEKEAKTLPKDQKGMNAALDKSLDVNEEGEVILEPLHVDGGLAAVSVLIDKTGFGAEFLFTEDERKKLIAADEIRLKEIEVVDLPAKVVRKEDYVPTESLQAEALKYTFANSVTAMCFPASGFRAEMRGLTYGELADIALDVQHTNVDQFYKRMTVVYNNMINISSGAFSSFDDFLENFAFADLPSALYGLYKSTQPELNTVDVRCLNENCRRSFSHTFSVTSLMRYEQTSPLALAKIEELLSQPSRAREIYENAPVRNVKIYKLPYSGCEVALSQISIADYIRNVVPTMDENNLRSLFGDDPNGTKYVISFLLTCVTAIYVPKDGSWVAHTNYRDILEVLYKLPPIETKYLFAMARKILNAYTVTFSLRDLRCPHCGAKIPNLVIDMDTLVFRTYQRLLSTEINVDSLQNL